MDDAPTGPGTVLITGAGRGLGLATAEALLRAHPELHLVLAVRDPDSTPLADHRRCHVVRCDLADLDRVRTAVATLGTMLDEGALPPLRAIVGNAGVQAGTAAQQTADGFELNFGTNVLGHYLLIRLLLDRLQAPGRIVLVSSGTHRGDFAHSGGMVPPPQWTSTAQLARPGSDPRAGTNKAGKRAYTTSKLGVIYLVHELARRVPEGIKVFSFDPGMLPGTGLAREGTAIERAMWHSTMHLMKVLPNVTTPASAGRSLAALTTGPAPAGSGAYVELDRVLKSSPESYDPVREVDLWTSAAALVGLRDGAAPRREPA